MADLSQQQQTEVAFYLGYPNKILQPDSTNYNQIFVNYLHNISDEALARVGELLELIKGMRKQLDQTSVDAHVTGIDELSFDARAKIDNVQRQYKRYIYELANTLDIRVKRVPGLGGVGSVRMVS